MKKDDFVDLMGDIDPELVQQVDQLRQKPRKPAGLRWLALAACAALAVTGAALLLRKPAAEQAPTLQGPLPGVQEELPEPAATAPAAERFPSALSGRVQLLDFSAEASRAVTPSVPSYSVEGEFSNVINYDQFYLSEEASDKLRENLFVVKPAYLDEFFELYEYNRYDLVPNYITVDSLMHTYHLYFSLLLSRTEKSYLAGQLLDLSQALLEASEAQYDALTGTVWEEAARRNVAYFAVAAALQEPDTAIPSCARELAGQELDAIYAAAGIAISPIAEDWMDYSQFLPRGYYEGDETLEAYFRAMMWYGQVNYAQDNDSLNRSALLMTLAMAETDPEAWERIYTVTGFFAGASDDLGCYEYSAAIESAYGGCPTLQLLLDDESAYERYCQNIAQLPAPSVNSIPVYQEQEGELGEMNKGFRFMGQRFTVDAAVMQQLVYRSVSGENAQGELRLLPDVLDLPAALGSDTALSLLEQQGETQYGGYSENMNALRTALSAVDDSAWSTSLYSSWLYTLMPLLGEKGTGYPSYMTTDLWRQKTLETFSGSFTELKHDTVLYSKQVVAEMGGAPTEERDDRGYVEPESEVYRRFTLLAAQTAQGLDAYGLLSDADRENLSRLEELARRLWTISDKELQNETLTDEEYDLIREYGGTLEHFWYEAAQERSDGEEYVDPAEIPASLVTDIATDPNGTVLELGCGRPANILVVVPVDGTLRIASGVVYDFYQFEQPLSQRLTDSQWRYMIGQWFQWNEDGSIVHSEEATPDKPWWTTGYWVER